MPYLCNNAGYGEFLKGLKEKIAQAQVKAALAVSHELVKLYWHIGREILQQQQAKGWGAQVIDRLSRDLKIAFPGQEGFSPSNLKYMRKFAEIWPDPVIVQQAVAQLPWGHQTVLMDKLDSAESRIWYIQMAITHGWSRNILTHQIETALMDRQCRAPTNFQQTLPSPQSDLAHQVLKDPYNLEFLTLH